MPCQHDQSLALLQFMKTFSIRSNASSWDFLYPKPYPKTESWKEGTDCCLWDGVTCEIETGNVIGLNLSSSLLYGTIHSNNSLFLLPHLQKLDLSNNDFNQSQIVPQFGQFLNLRQQLEYLNFNGNQLQGRIPPSISNCINLEILDLGNNNIDDTFPYFLETLSKLQILILKSNKFHGLVKGTFANYSFSKLRIFDLSNNLFSGPLPAEYFNDFKAMMIFDLNMKYMGAPNYSSYDYSVSLTLKGLEIELVKIQTLLTSIDLSGNKFTGEIPQSIGKLESLKLLNLSHNQLTGNIQPSLGNLSNLESLDLSSNLLVGRIPTQLTYLTFLEVFRVSHNQLEGPIPEGKQFNTFDNTSYEGNLGLCGFPLEKCDNGERQQPTSSKEIDSKSKIGFGWKAISAGYGCGVIFGIAMGYVVFKTRKPTWPDQELKFANEVRKAQKLCIRGADVPDRVWYGRDVSYDHLCVFCCKCFMHVPEDERSKLDAKTRPCIFIGYGQDEFGYRCYDPVEKKLVRSRGVIFVEDQTIKDIDKAERSKSETNGFFDLDRYA
ncbi:hypothetical protein GH714_011547 [Hevea brasiliensis]|uniref:Uncharacterized protein n=1 Tax=Hevea brasiliensis TaxID=3981 RepID=A0A6A6MY79_HEVBR|nr:hypothetical protein GH714_011547 [Hevea brasiliensis]